MASFFSVKYCKVDYEKKEETWKEGFLLIRGEWIWLKDQNKVTIRKGLVKPELIKILQIPLGCSICGDFRIQTISALSETVGITSHCVKDDIFRLKSHTIPEKSLTEIPKNYRIKSPEKEEESNKIYDNTCRKRKCHPQDVANRLDTSSVDENRKSLRPTVISVDDSQKDDSKNPYIVSLDEKFYKIMKSHQIEAAKFLIYRLQGYQINENKNIQNKNTGSTVNQEHTTMNRNTPKQYLSVTGAILGDDMGTGKTLTSLSVIWSFCRSQATKAITVCPASLLKNWEKEIQKWLPASLGRTALIIHSNNSQGAKSPKAIVTRFATSAATIHPLLVLSYEMYRSYADILGDIPSLDLLVCDEGHRLKNAYGTKTAIALGNCCAQKRLVITGTPIQNNLDELFAVVQFACPNFLGSLQEFQETYGGKIELGRREDATEDMKSEAKAAAESLGNKLASILIRRTAEEVLSGVLPSRQIYLVKIPLQPQQSEAYKAVSGRLLGQVEDRSCVLSGLLKLRQICNGAEQPLPENRVENIPHPPNMDLKETPSAKLQVLQELLRSINQSGERVVVASLFCDTLDQIQVMAGQNGWKSLRIDGSVPVDRRDAILNHFNREKSPFFLMLLSTRAGGVGLSLVGASRMVLLEPDWNPATDQQAMGRVWRQGQTKPVVIYRFVTANSLEESIISRQKDKEELGKLLRTGEADDSYNENEVPVVTTDSIGIISSNISSQEGLRDLIFPSPTPENEVTVVDSNSNIDTHLCKTIQSLHAMPLSYILSSSCI